MSPFVKYNLAVAAFSVLPASNFYLPSRPPLNHGTGKLVLESHSPDMVFEGRTPCGSIATQFTGFPSQGCEKIKWRLTLVRSTVRGTPNSYRYEGTRSSHAGRWLIRNDGRAQASGAGYVLTPDDRRPGLSLLSIDDKVLLLLDHNGQVLVGDASWSYVLNRIEP